MDHINYSSDKAQDTESINQQLPSALSALLADNVSFADIAAVSVPLNNIAEQTFALATFKSARDNKPENSRLTWAEFVHRMSQNRALRSKEHAQAFSPVEYWPGANRGNKWVVSVSMAVFDFDNSVSVEKAKEVFTGYTYLIHSSFNHSVEKPKFRVILPLTAPVPVKDWPQVWEAINARFGNHNDPAVKDASRIYYVYSYPVGGEVHFCESFTGKALDTDELMSAISDVTLPDVVTDTELNEPTNSVPGSLRGLEEMVMRCNFMREVSDPGNQSSVSEPHWKAMISNAVCFEGGEAWTHAASRAYPKYSEEETDHAIQRAKSSGYGPQTCLHIRKLGYQNCPKRGCRLSGGGRTKSPAGLGASWTSGTSRGDKGGRELEGAWGRVVDSFLEKHFPDGLKYINSVFFGYADGYWKELDELVEVEKPMLMMMYGQLDKGNESKTAFSLLMRTVASLDIFTERREAFICLLNGTYDLSRYQLVSHSPSHNLTNRIEVNWDEGASCNRWDRFLHEIFAPDQDREEKISFMQEWFGYCLVADSSQHKFLWLVGAGGNGKSVLLAVLEMLLGAKNVSHAHIERLGNQVVRAELQNKLANISAEMGSEATLADGYLKSIVAGDSIEAERKYKPSFSFTPYVRLIAATNHLPRLQDLSDGFFRRAIIIGFNRQFSEHERDPDLTKHLQSELSGILRWAVNGLERLRANKRFTIPASSIDTVNHYRTDSDVVAIFAKLLIRTTDRGITPMDIYRVFSEWASARGFKTMTLPNFGKRLAALGFTSHRSGGKTYWRVRIPVQISCCDDDIALNQHVTNEQSDRYEVNSVSGSPVSDTHEGPVKSYNL